MFQVLRFEIHFFSPISTFHFVACPLIPWSDKAFCYININSSDSKEMHNFRWKFKTFSSPSTALYRCFVHVFFCPRYELNFMNFFSSFSLANFLCFICYEFCTIFFLVSGIKFALDEQPEKASRVVSCFKVHVESNRTVDLTFASSVLYKIHLTKSKPQGENFSGENFRLSFFFVP